MEKRHFQSVVYSRKDFLVRGNCSQKSVQVLDLSPSAIFSIMVHHAYVLTCTSKQTTESCPRNRLYVTVSVLFSPVFELLLNSQTTITHRALCCVSQNSHHVEFVYNFPFDVQNANQTSANVFLSLFFPLGSEPETTSVTY